MRRIFAKFLAACVCIASSMTLKAIEPTWHIDFSSVFDNREGDSKMTHAGTYFFTSFAPEVGLKFTPSDRIAGGAVWTQPLENSIKNGKIIPTLYYRHEGEKWKFSMGMFPRTQLREKLAGFMWCDSMEYFQRNIRGAMVQYEDRKGFFDAYIDWRGMQSKTTREAFNIVFHGEMRPRQGSFLLGAHAKMNHLAKTKPADDDQYVVDNFMINPYVGWDVSHKTALDSLVIKAGGIFAMDRNRKDGKWNTPGGIWVEGVFEWKFLGLKNSLYAGGKLFTLHGEFGHYLYQGEPYYQSSFYDRADVYARIYRNKYINLEAQLNFHFTRREFMFYQRLMLDINIGN